MPAPDALPRLNSRGALTLRFAGPEERPAVLPAGQSTGVAVWLNRQGGVVARGFRDGGSYWMAWPSLATYEFSTDTPFITAHPVDGASTEVIWDVYRRSVLPMALQVHGWEALHASAVVSRAGVIAFCAVSETGKSTLAFGLRQRGFPQWSDDGVVFRTEDGVQATPLPFHARLRPETQTLFGVGAPIGLEGNQTGEQHFVHERPLARICLLKRVEHAASPAPTVRLVAPPEAFTALLVHAHEFDPDDANRRARMLRAYLDLAASVPVVEVAFTPDRARFPQFLDAIVDALGMDAPTGGLDADR